MPYPAFHFLLLAAGEVLKYNKHITPLKLQNFISDDDSFAVRPLLSDCKTALRLLENSGFLLKVDKDNYIYK